MKMSKYLQHAFAAALDVEICGNRSAGSCGPGDNIAAMREAWLIFYDSAGLTPKRARWDAVFSIPHEQRQALFDRAYRDERLDDSHVDTMLRVYFAAPRAVK